VPSETRHDRSRRDDSSDPTEAQQEIQVEDQAVGGIEAPHSTPRIRSDQHPWLGHEIRAPREDPGSPSSSVAHPEHFPSFVDVSTATERHDGIPVFRQHACRGGQRPFFQQIIVIEPGDERVVREPLRDPEVDGFREAPWIGYVPRTPLRGHGDRLRCFAGGDHDDVGWDRLRADRGERLLKELRPSPEGGNDEEDFGTRCRSLHLRYRRDVPHAHPDSSAALAEGAALHSLAKELFPVTRSITGDGVRRTLGVIADQLPGLRIHEVPSGTPVLDWTVPDEWNVRDAFVEDPTGARIIDFSTCNVHLVSYSEPTDVRLPLHQLREHLHVDHELPTAIPYVTSYYNRTWGFSLSAEQERTLLDGEYHAVVDSTLEDGHLTYGELVVPGDVDDEVFISTYVCHPSLANNELSGPMVAVGLARWLAQQPDLRYTYRFVFAPETIGAITYIAGNLAHLRSHVVAAINLTCIGDDGDYSYLASRMGNTPLDRIAKRVVKTRPQPVIYTYLDRGSDERHYGMPNVDLPMISLMRTKYGKYPEYHTHLDDLTVVTPSGLQGGLDLVRDCVRELESSQYFQGTVAGEPQLGKRGLYHTMHARTVADEVLVRTHILAYADGQHSIEDMAEMFGLPQQDVQLLIDELVTHGLLVPTHLKAVRH
jgi:aminopeptidase-like protein